MRNFALLLQALESSISAGELKSWSTDLPLTDLTLNLEGALQGLDLMSSSVSLASSDRTMVGEPLSQAEDLRLVSEGELNPNHRFTRGDEAKAGSDEAVSTSSIGFKNLMSEEYQKTQTKVHILQHEGLENEELGFPDKSPLNFLVSISFD